MATLNKHGLPNWAPDDKPQMAEFNAAFNTISENSVWGISAGNGISVNNADPANPIVSTSTEYGENANGSYRKHDNGTLEIWKQIIVSNVAISGSWGAGVFISPKIEFGTLPYQFKGGYQTWAWFSSSFGAAGILSATSTEVNLWRGQSYPGVSGTLEIYAKGKWK